LRACKYYAPNEEIIREHDGIEAGPNYKFDELLPFSSCTCPAVIGDAPFAQCGYEANQLNCSAYDPEAATHVCGAMMGDMLAVLERSRGKFGIIEYQVMLYSQFEKIDDSTYRIIPEANGIESTRYNAHALGEGYEERVYELFAEHTGTEEFVDVTDPETRESYILNVLS